MLPTRITTNSSNLGQSLFSINTQRNQCCIAISLSWNACSNYIRSWAGERITPQHMCKYCSPKLWTPMSRYCVFVTACLYTRLTVALWGTLISNELRRGEEKNSKIWRKENPDAVAGSREDKMRLEILCGCLLISFFLYTADCKGRSCFCFLIYHLKKSVSEESAESWTICLQFFLDLGLAIFIRARHIVVTRENLLIFKRSTRISRVVSIIKFT